MTQQRAVETEVKTVDRMFTILEKVRELDGARISELGEELDMANSTICRHLTTLRKHGYAVKEGDTYHVGLRFLDFATYARNRKRAFKMARPKVEELADETNERVQFIVEENGYGVYMYRALGQQAVQTDPGLGKRSLLHYSAAGKAILSELPHARVERIIVDRGLPRHTKNTITDRESLLEELQTIREQGYSVNKEEYLEGLRAIGTAISPSNGVVLGALSVSGPANRMKGPWFEEELPDLLLGTANELELNIAYS